MIYVGVIGEGECSESTGQLAYQVGSEIASAGAVLVCGGLGGVMLRACEGARVAGGVTIGVLPGGNRMDANPFLNYSIPTGMGEARNSVVVRSSDVLIAVGGSYGTLSEIAFALKMGKPVIGIKTWHMKDGGGNIPPIKYTEDAGEAVKAALDAVLSAE